MDLFWKEYADASLIAWTITFAILSLPFLVKKIENVSIVFHQMVNFILSIGRLIAGITTSHIMCADDAISIGFFIAFGVSYSILAIRKKSILEKVLGNTCLIFFTGLFILEAIKFIDYL